MKASKLLLLSAVCLIAGCDNNKSLTKQEHIKKAIGDHPCLITPLEMSSNKVSENAYYKGDAKYVYYYNVQYVQGDYYHIELCTLFTLKEVKSETQKVKESEIEKISLKTIYSIG